MYHTSEQRTKADGGLRRSRPAIMLMVAALAALALTGCTPAFGRQNASPTPSSTTSTGPTTGNESTTGDKRSRPADRQVRLNERPMSTADNNAFQDTGGSEVTERFVYNYLDQVVHSVDKFWTSYFTSHPPLRDPSVRYVIVTPNRTFRTNCSDEPVTSDYNNAFYCPADADNVNDGSIVLPLQTFQKFWQGNVFGRKTQKGDFVAAAIVAHEFGHHIQAALANQLDLPDIVDNSGSQPKRSKNKELIADCFAGLWSRSVYQRGYLSDGDLDEAVQGFEAIGDRPGGSGSDPHGSPEERRAAFLLGLNSGMVSTCGNTYWPATNWK